MEINELVQAIQTLNAEDAFRARLNLEQWRTIAPYLTRHDIRSGDLLIKQGDADRSMYFLAQGSLQVFVTGGPPGSSRIAILRAGSVVGEPGLFGETARMANVEAMTPCVVWALRGPRLDRNLPHFLTLADIRKLLAAPSGEDTFGRRDKAMLETLYS